MVESLRQTGIEPIGPVAWGTHFCLFFRTKQDLLDVLVPYFKAGLENNEFCMWVTAEPLDAGEAQQALAAAMPGFDRYLAAGQIEILPFSAWHTRGGAFDSERVLLGWQQKLDAALAHGFAGLRVNGNTSPLDKKDWPAFAAYEAAADVLVACSPMLALCAYPLDACTASEAMDVIGNHDYALLRQGETWELVSSRSTRMLRAEIAERQQAELALKAERQQFSDVLDTLPAYLILLTPDYHVAFANRFFRERFGESHGRRCFDYLFHRTEPCEICDTYKVLRAMTPLEWEWTGPDGRNYHIYDFPFKDTDGSTMIMETGIDITEQKEAAAALRQAHDELERRVEERTAQLAAANRELEAFSYSVSHDLRVPLGAINMLAYALVEECAGQMPAAAEERLQAIRQATRQMDQLISALLSFSRQSSHPLEKEAVRPAELARAVAAELLAAEGQRQVELSIADLPPCQADPHLLRQVWANLLANALKFTRSRQPAVITVGTVPHDGGQAYFVRDNGVGFDMQQAGKLFGVFQRLHSAGEYEGNGVGLALVERIVQRHGGRVWAVAAPDKGATFYFTLSCNT